MFARWCVGAQSSQFATHERIAFSLGRQPHDHHGDAVMLGNILLKRTFCVCFIPDYLESHASTEVTMKTEEKNSSPKVRIAVLGNMNVGKSGELCKST